LLDDLPQQKFKKKKIEKRFLVQRCVFYKVNSRTLVVLLCLMLWREYIGA